MAVQVMELEARPVMRDVDTGSILTADNFAGFWNDNPAEPLSNESWAVREAVLERLADLQLEDLDEDGYATDLRVKQGGL